MAVATPAAQAGSKGPKKVKEWKSPDEGQGKLAAIMLSPTMLVLVAVIGFPILAGIRESFYTSGGLDASGFVSEGSKFVGLDNYQTLIADRLGLGSDELVACGLSLGYADTQAPVNRLNMPREPLDNVARWHGFDE